MLFILCQYFPLILIPGLLKAWIQLFYFSYPRSYHLKFKYNPNYSQKQQISNHFF